MIADYNRNLLITNILNQNKNKNNVKYELVSIVGAGHTPMGYG
jgi:hypothetical protein